MSTPVDLKELLQSPTNLLYQELVRAGVDPAASVAFDSLLRGRFTSFQDTLQDFTRFVAASATSVFWKTKETMRARPEGIAQALVASYLTGRLPKPWIVSIEHASGRGRVDVFVAVNTIRYVIEIKVLRRSPSSTAIRKSVQQTLAYMNSHDVTEGYLMFFDAATPGAWNDRGLENCDGRTVHILRADIRNVTPSCLGESDTEVRG